MRILNISKEAALSQVMRQIKVDPYGIKIMLPKARYFLIKIDSLSSISANILKQEMLSAGGDVALARDALTGKAKITDCLIMGNLAQIDRLIQKLTAQPFGLDKIARDLKTSLKNYQRTGLKLSLGNRVLNLGARSHIMGIVNLTPDSFSGDGLYARPFKLGAILDYAQGLVAQGADILDLGGESSRPGARPIPLKVELSRTIPVIKSLAKKIKIPISIDTTKPEVARQALDNGADLVNDITALSNSKMAKLIARYKAGVVIMHMQGNPRSMQKTPHYASLIDEIMGYLSAAIKRGQDAGIDNTKIIIDPGIGFGKRIKDNLELLRKLGEFKVLGMPILVGPSRKSFIGELLKASPQERIFGTLAACVLACENGAHIVRVHDVGAVKQGLLIRDNINR